MAKLGFESRQCGYKSKSRPYYHALLLARKEVSRFLMFTLIIVFYCCITNHHKLSILQQVKNRRGSISSLMRVSQGQSTVLSRLGSYLEVPGKNQLPAHPHCRQSSVPMVAQSARLPTGCRPRVGLSLEAAMGPDRSLHLLSPQQCVYPSCAGSL